jgi:AcrR family transcriptional regulator/DNA-binding MarR family transcriptional regulator
LRGIGSSWVRRDLRKLVMQRPDHKRQWSAANGLADISGACEAHCRAKSSPCGPFGGRVCFQLDSKQMLTMGNIKLTRSIGGLLEHIGGSERSTRSNVEEIQRSRILGAMAEEVAIRGASSVTVARVIARAGVSRRLFYELFADIEDCFLAAFDWAVAQARTAAVEASAPENDWREGIRAGLASLLRFFDDQPLLAQLCIVHAAGGGPRVLEHRSRIMAELCEAIDRGRREGSGSRVPGPVVAEGVVGAVLAVLYTRLLAQGVDPERGDGDSGAEQPGLIGLHGELMSLIVLPYLGAGVAGRELRKPPPQPRAGAAPIDRLSPRRSAQEEPAARLTYRTVRVLRAIAELPAGSNREVAERAGIVDQGQISKILTRLEYQGLVVNRGAANPARGTPNSWWLTERGEELELELREHSSQSPPRNGSGSRRPAK